MVGAIVYGFLVYCRGKTCHFGKTNDLVFYPLLQECGGSLHSTREGGKTGYPFDSLFSKLDLFGLDGLTSLASLPTTNIGLFFGVGAPAKAWLGLVLVLKLEDLRTDSLVRQAASINLEKEEKDRDF